MRIWNLTQHKATPSQIADGVCDLPSSVKEELVKLLTFEEIPTPEQLRDTAWSICGLLLRVQDGAFNERMRVMIGGFLPLMSHLEAVLLRHDIIPVYSSSKRESIDEPQGDGSVIKRVVFNHIGFVEVSPYNN
jgi:hypothetical protein